MARNTLTTRDYWLARKMARGGQAVESIAPALDGRYPASLIARALNDKRRYYQRHEGMAAVASEMISIVPPPEVLEQREHRVMLRPTSLTALLQGDPLPGESALDRRKLATA